MRRSGAMRIWETKAVIFESLTALILVAALVIAVAVEPPGLGWIGFGIVALVAFALCTLATLAVPRLRVSPPPAMVPSDNARRLLVVVDANCSEVDLCREIDARLDGAVAVHLVVPVRVSHLHFLTDDEAEDRLDAVRSMLVSIGLLQLRGVAVTGTVGTDKPLESMTDALASFPATQVLLALPPEDERYWLEEGLLAKARALSPVAVGEVVVPSRSSVTHLRATA